MSLTLSNRLSGNNFALEEEIIINEPFDESGDIDSWTIGNSAEKSFHASGYIQVENSTGNSDGYVHRSFTVTKIDLIVMILL